MAEVGLGRAAKQAQEIRADLLERLLAGTEADILGLRDRALLQVAYDTLSRRSELVALRIEDIRRHDKLGEPKMTIFLRRSKTDPEGHGRWGKTDTVMRYVEQVGFVG